jgi:hypothetical protein
VKVFISHKSTDASTAAQVQRAFTNLGVNAYLDLLDSFSGDGEKLTAHIKEQLNKCSDIIVVMSTVTITSWWVPFEIGMSAQIDMPTATFLTSSVALPDYLAYWPKLTKISDIAKYVSVRNRVWHTDALFESRTVSSTYNTGEFYRQLRTELRRP